MKVNCFLCLKNEPSVGKFCQECLKNYGSLLFKGRPLSSLQKKYQYINLRNKNVSEVQKAESLPTDWFLERGTLTYKDEPYFTHGFVFDIDIDSNLDIISFVCLIPHSFLLKSGGHYSEMLRKYDSKKVRKVFMGDSGDFTRPLTDIIPLDSPLSQWITLSSITLVPIPIEIVESVVVYKGPKKLFSGANVLNTALVFQREVFNIIYRSVPYISTKISPNLLRSKLEDLIKDPNIEIKKGFMRDFFSKIINEYLKSAE